MLEHLAGTESTALYSTNTYNKARIFYMLVHTVVRVVGSIEEYAPRLEPAFIMIVRSLSLSHRSIASTLRYAQVPSKALVAALEAI